MENTNIKIRSVEGQIIEFDNKFKNLSKLVEMTEDQGEIISDIAADVLLVIRKFCELHDYNPDSIEYKSPLKSEKLIDNIDPKSYIIMKDYFGLKDDEAEKMRPLVYAAYHLDFEKLKEVCLVTLGCPFFIGNDQLDIDRFRQIWDIGDISPEEERHIMEENKPIFDNINEIFEIKMQQEEQRYLQSFQESQNNNSSN